jgi:hypothetical protein
MGINRAYGSKRLGILAAAAARLVFAAFAILAFSAVAEAAPLITFVASDGNDANPCSVVTAPCKTLQRAVNVAAANGTVKVLTPLQNNAVITKNITISGDGAPIVGIIVINSSTAVVTLRGLALNGIGGFANGIRIDAAAAVHIEDCTVERYTGDGIHSASAASELFVSGTVARDNGDDGLHAASAQVSIEDSLFENNISVGVALYGARANVIRSTASGNYHGIFMTGGTTNVTEMAAVGNGHGNGGVGFYFGPDASATLASSVARGNHHGVLLSAGAAVSITESIITSNSGTAISNAGTLYTRQNNTVGGSLSGNAPIAFPAL